MDGGVDCVNRGVDSVNRGGVGDQGGVVGGGGVGGLGMGLALVPHVGDESVLVVSVVRDDLDAAVGELNSVLSLDHAILVLGLSLGEVSAVLVSASILVGEWLGGHLLWVVGGGGRMK